MIANSRTNQRVKTTISCIFGVTPDTPRSGTITSLSAAGCFVRTKSWATSKATMHVRLWLPAERWLRLEGTVLYHLDQIGFGLLFTGVTPDDLDALKELVDFWGSKPALVEEKV